MDTKDNVSSSLPESDEDLSNLQNAIERIQEVSPFEETKPNPNSTSGRPRVSFKTPPVFNQEDRARDWIDIFVF